MTANIYTTSPPEHPPHPWSRFVCISDTHSKTLSSIPHGDVLIHAGDLSSWGRLTHLRTTILWLASLPHKTKIVIAGNHDLCLDSDWKDTGNGGLMPEEIDAAQELLRSEAMRNAGIIYLDHEQAEIETSRGTKWKVYGSPAAPLYVQGAFQYTTNEEAKAEWSQIPLDVEILLTHTPPFRTHDVTKRGKNAGCSVLASRIDELPSCRLHVFGHIHEANGASIQNRDQQGNSELVSVNAAIFNGTQPIVVDLKKET